MNNFKCKILQYIFYIFVKKSLEKDCFSEIKKIDFSKENELFQLMNLYENYSQKFNGTLVRNDINYWNQWIFNESKNQYSLCFYQNNRIKSYLIAGMKKKFPDQLIVKDFAVDEEEFLKDRGKKLFNIFIIYILENFIYQDSVIQFITYPAPLFLENLHNDNSSQIIEDMGQMYLFLDQSGIELEEYLIPEKHLFWSIDAF